MQKINILQDFPEASQCLTVQADLLLRQDMFLKKSNKSKTEFPFKTVYFLGVRGLPTSKYIAYDYITSGHTDL
jgi:hypothetical protein